MMASCYVNLIITLIVAIVIDRPGIRDFIKKDDCLVARQKPRNDIDRLRSIRVRASLP
jgi:hypothetical protein